MFIIIMVLILVTCMSVLSSIYYNTTALQKTYWSVNSYYWAYYWAISSIERWLLMSKVKYPGYEWSWWFKWDQIFWAISNGFSNDFWRLSRWNNSMMRYVDSKTNKIAGTIDTKTLRTISFLVYDDPDSESYTSEWVWSPYWLTQWLTFFGSANPSIWERYTNTQTNTQESNVDFNRFFGLTDPGYTVRWLLKDAINLSFIDEKEYPLSWDFNFWTNNTNPRPELSGRRGE